MDCLLSDFGGSAASRVNSDPTETGKAPRGWAHANSICRNEFHRTKLHIFSMTLLCTRKIFLPERILEPIFKVTQNVI